jgi:hypothetical protein
MSYRHLVAVAASLALISVQGSCMAQALPDWSGTWVPIPGAGLSAADPPPVSDQLSVPQYTDLAIQMRRSARANPGYRPNQAACIPKGMPLDMGTTGVAFEFLHSPGRVTVIWENGFVRRIYTDGRRHADNPDPRFSGDSIGRWDGQTLVVDTIAIVTGAELGPLLPGTGKTHVAERMTRRGKDRFEIEFTVTDSDLLRRPWKFTRQYQRSSHG